MKKYLKDNIIFVFDVDGTLMQNSQNSFDLCGVEALLKAAEFGEIIIASARPLDGILFLFDNLPLKPKAIIALNGAITYLDNKIIEYSYISQPLVKKITDTFKENCEIWFYTKNYWFYLNTVSDYRQKEIFSVGFSPRPAEEIKQEDKILKMTLISDNLKNMMTDNLQLNQKLSFYTSNPGYMEAAAFDVGKDKALNNIKNFLNIEKATVFAIGDSDNDITLLKNADFSCTVGNASNGAKKYSRYSSKDFYGEGALDCVLKFIRDIFRSSAR